MTSSFVAESKTEAIKCFKKCHDKYKTRHTTQRGRIGHLGSESSADIWFKNGTTHARIAECVPRVARPNIGLNSDDPVLSFAYDMSGGSIQYAQNLMTQSGAIPTLASIRHVREDILPAAMRIINQVTPPPKTKRNKKQQDKAIKKQQQNADLIELSEYAATYIPRPLPLGLSATERKELIVLSEDKFRNIQHDLDIFETLLNNPQEDTSNSIMTSESLLGAGLEWIVQKMNRHCVHDI